MSSTQGALRPGSMADGYREEASGLRFMVKMNSTRIKMSRLIAMVATPALRGANRYVCPIHAVAP